MEKHNRLFVCGVFLGIFTPAVSLAKSSAVPIRPSAQVATDDAERGVEEIIVTAQKRQQTANSVGMTINAVTGKALQSLGVSDTADLSKVVPGSVYAPRGRL